MSEEKTEQEQESAPVHHEMSETPFGASRARSAETEPEVPEEQPAVVPEPTAEDETADEPEAAAETAAEPEPEPQQMDSMEAAMQAAEQAGSGVDYSGTFQTLTEGEVVDGVVVHIDREGVLVDVGTKSEGTIKPGELSRDPTANPEDVVSVGEKIRVYVVEADSQDGGPVLSKKRADFENAWERVEGAAKTGEMLKAMVTDRVKGGLVVDLGIRGFVPASHVGSGKIKNLDKFVGQSMPFKVIEVDRERRKVVLSNRFAAEQEREEQKKETIRSLTEGQIREGVVRRLTDYGAFVDLGGVDGLLHISEMSWTRITHPSEVVRPGQRIQVMVLKLNLEQGRVSLGLRQILPDPWVEIRQLHSVGDVIKGTVSRLVPFGAFVQVEGGVEGIIPNAELAVRRINKPEDVVSVGQEVEVKVVDLRPDERRMTLSVRQLQREREREHDDSEYRSYTQTRQEGKTTIGDLIGDQLDDLTASVAQPAKPARKRSKAKAARKQAFEEEEALAEADELLLEEEIEAPQAELAAIEEPAEPQPAETEAAVEVAEAAPEQPSAEEPAAQEPVTEEPVAEKPKAKAPRKRASAKKKE